MTARVFAWQQAKHIYINHYKNKESAIVQELNGPLFFGSVHNFSKMRPMVLFDFKNCRGYDHSAIEAIDSLAGRWQAPAPETFKRGMQAVAEQRGRPDEINVMEDPPYHVATVSWHK